MECVKPHPALGSYRHIELQLEVLDGFLDGVYAHRSHLLSFRLRPDALDKPSRHELPLARRHQHFHLRPL